MPVQPVTVLGGGFMASCSHTGMAVPARPRGAVAEIVVVAVVVLGWIAGAQAAPVSAQRVSGVSLRASIPWEALSARDCSLVGDVVRGATIRHRMPTQTVECEPELFALLIDRPELVVEVWNLMGVSKLRLDPTGPAAYRAVDATGAVGDVRVVHQGLERNGVRTVVAYCAGAYQAPPMPKSLSADSVIVFRWSPVESREDQTRIRADLDSFVVVDRGPAQLLAKAMRPLLTRTAEHNFVETLRFISLFSTTAERNPAGMLRLANHLEKIDEPTRRRFVEACRVSAERSAQRLEQRRRVALVASPAMK